MGKCGTDSRFSQDESLAMCRGVAAGAHPPRRAQFPFRRGKITRHARDRTRVSAVGAVIPTSCHQEDVEVETGASDRRAFRPPRVGQGAAPRQGNLCDAGPRQARPTEPQRVFVEPARDSGVKFVAADMPEPSSLTVGILACVAEAERDAVFSPRQGSSAGAQSPRSAAR
jgi:hypothetical protein